MITAVLGAYGGIGEEICRMLLNVEGIEVRAFGRRQSEAEKILADIFDKITYVNTEPGGIQEIKNHLENVEILINAAGIQGEKELEIIRICRELQIVYLSPGGQNKEAVQEGCIFDAGSMPGLSLLLPRILAKSMNEPVASLEFYYCVQDSFSRNAARDYIEGLFDEEKKMMVTYENGTFIPFTDQGDFYIPFLEGKKKRYPFFDKESEFLVKELDLQTGSWFMVLEGEKTMKVLEECRRIYGTDQELAIDKLCRASSLDTFQHGRYSAIYMEMKTENHKGTCLVRCANSARLTALASVLCVISLQNHHLKNFGGTFGTLDLSSQIIDHLYDLADEVLWETDENEAGEFLAGEL